jgi:hypothetical protein
LSEHNIRVLTQTQWTILKKTCSTIYRKDVQPFSHQCNLELEYPCLRANVDDPWNFTTNYPCIPLSSIGDGKIDCYGQQDERNTVTVQVPWLVIISFVHYLLLV